MPSARSGALAALLISVPALAPASETASASGHRAYPAAPTPITSFAAEALEGRVYIYGGHAGAAHQYSEATTLSEFWALDIAEGRDWKKLPGQSRAQGARLVAHQGDLYRVGGLSVRDGQAPDKPVLVSLDDFSRFDVDSETWTSLTPMPDARSSHEAVVVGDHVVVGGGWKMVGQSEDSEWADNLFVANLTKSPIKWTTVDQPFKRRALSAAALGGKVYFIGGMDDTNDTSREVDVYDVSNNSWSKGPKLPNGPMKGFGSAACEYGDTILVSPYSGEIYALNALGDAWDEAGALASKRFFHRIVPAANGAVLAIAGASRKSGHTDSVEWIPISAAAANK